MYYKSFDKHTNTKIFSKNWGKLFSKSSVRKLFETFQTFRKNFRQETFRKVFRENVGNFFVRRLVRKPSKIPPGLFRKKWGLFVRNRFGNVCFLHKFRGKICVVSLRIPAVSRKILGGISPEIPGNSGGKTRGFFPVFSVFHGCNTGLTP